MWKNRRNIAKSIDYWGNWIRQHKKTLMDDLGLDVQMYLLDKVPTYKKNYVGYMLKFYLWTFVDIIKDRIKYSKMISDAYKNVHKKRLPIIEKNTIVIYPDVVYGNPLNGEKVIR